MVNVGIVGAGNIGRVHSRAYANLPNAKVVAVADIDEARAAEMAQSHEAIAYPDVPSLLADASVQMVDVCLPTYLHAEAVIAAAGAGKHVLCEKPVALRLDQADRMLAAVERAGVACMIAQVIRFWPHYLAIKDLLDRGELGKPVMTYAARFGQTPSFASWYADPELSGGAVLDLHIHDLDWLYYLFGKPQRVYATGTQGARGSWNQVLTNLDYGSNRAAAEATFFMPPGHPFTMLFRALGEKGYAEYRYGGGQRDPQGQATVHSLTAYLNGQPAQALDCPAEDAYLAEIRYFVDCLDRGEKPALATLGEARTVLEIALAAKSSLETGQVITL